MICLYSNEYIEDLLFVWNVNTYIQSSLYNSAFLCGVGGGVSTFVLLAVKCLSINIGGGCTSDDSDDSQRNAIVNIPILSKQGRILYFSLKKTLKNWTINFSSLTQM